MRRPSGWLPPECLCFGIGATTVGGMCPRFEQNLRSQDWEQHVHVRVMHTRPHASRIVRHAHECINKLVEGSSPPTNQDPNEVPLKRSNQRALATAAFRSRFHAPVRTRAEQPTYPSISEVPCQNSLSHTPPQCHAVYAGSASDW